jgi:hypothetical protein
MFFICVPKNYNIIYEDAANTQVVICIVLVEALSSRSSTWSLDITKWKSLNHTRKGVHSQSDLLVFMNTLVCVVGSRHKVVVFCPSFVLIRHLRPKDCVTVLLFRNSIVDEGVFLQIFEPHKERSAFTVRPLGFHEYTRMPFGMTISPATYQRLMEDCLADYHLRISYIFIDDGGPRTAWQFYYSGIQ